jgi:hypothetical protein
MICSLKFVVIITFYDILEKSATKVHVLAVFEVFLLLYAKFHLRIKVQVEYTFDESATWYYQYKNPTWFIAAYDIRDKGE